MTEQEILGLIENALSNHSSKIMDSVNSTVNGAIARVSKETEAKLATFTPAKIEEDKSESGTLQYQTLKQELEALRVEREMDKKKSFQLQRDVALTDSLSNLKVVNPKAFKKLVLAEYGENITEENGQWYLADGDSVKPLNDALGQYLDSEEGQIFKPASGISGTGAKSGSTPPIKPQEDLQTALNKLFQNKK
jgi:hypothetical protein